MKKIFENALFIAILIPLATGALSSLLSGGMDKAMVMPNFAPPGWLFPVVWTILYCLMGYAAYLVQTSKASFEQKRKALLPYWLQLAANFLWSPLFFRWKLYLTALLWLVVLWGLIFWNLRRFSKINERAGDLLIPYILWVTFAFYLNLGVFLLN